MSFLLFAQSHGLNVDYIKATDKIEHCGTHAKPKSSNGRYRFNGTDGWVMDWSIDTTVHFYGDKTVKTFTDADKKAWAENKRKEEQAEQRKYAEAAQRAADVLKFAKSKTHYYLNSKGFPDALGLVVEHVLVIPMRNLDTNALQGIQSIEWDGETKSYIKKMFYGMKAKGAVLRMGNKTASEHFLCEGYATALSIEAALRQLRLNASVVVCFSAGNLVHVASLMQGQRAYVIADNDASGTGEKAAIKTGLPWSMPDTEGMDANDVHQASGVMAVCRLVMKAKQSGLRRAA